MLETSGDTSLIVAETGGAVWLVGQAILPAILPADALSSASQPAGNPAGKIACRPVVATVDVIEEHPDNQPNPKVLFMAHVQGELRLWIATVCTS